jgi:molybdopterin molybdotransferase
LRIVGESAAGRGWDGVLRSGEAVRIMTGARVPEGADAVQQVELTNASGDSVTIIEPAREGKNIVRYGAEVRRGARLFSKGERITRQMVASLASFGYANVRTARRPRLSVLSTGSEIVDIADRPGKDQIRNSNSAMLAAFAEELADVAILPIAVDDQAGLKEIISKALANCDCLVISGGVSVGDYDFTKPVLREIGTEIVFEKLRLKPGKPTVFGTFDGKYVFGLPGNPVSIAVTFLVFVRMALLLMQGASDAELPRGRAVLTHDIKGAPGRDGMLPVKTGFNDEGRLTVESLKFSGSSNFVTFARADALVFVPADKGLAKGDIAEVFFF